ncbi:MAG: CRTAC1 family protein [Verrucomicrobiales bacterium]|nr:CRTAC1 family protein [Verrucomicrobiales bacterium]
MLKKLFFQNHKITGWILVPGLMTCVLFVAFSCKKKSEENKQPYHQGVISDFSKIENTEKDEESHQRMLSLLAEIRDLTSTNNQYLGDGRARKAREILAKATPQTPAKENWFHHRILGWAELNLGNETEGIKHLKLAYDLLPEVKGSIEEKRVMENIFMLGVAWMRRGETENCCAISTPESCIIPIRGGGIHSKEEGSRNAMQYFDEILKKAPTKSVWHYRARWLLNIAWMTLGQYPESVPEKYLIPEESFRSNYQFPVLHNIAADLGIDTFNLSGGVVIDDFNNDNYLDLFTTSWASDAAPKLFISREDGSFSEPKISTRLEGIYGGLNLEPADFNNDGNLDVFVLRGAWLASAGSYPNSLLRNNGDGTFTDVSFNLGLANIHRPTQTAGWADFDNDGDLDIFVGNETTPGNNAPCQLFRNDGELGFVDVALSAGVTNDRFTKGVSWGDYNNDRYPDLYVSNFRSENRLYHNNGDGTFTDLGPKLKVTGPSSSFPAWFWDYDNDGNLDIFVSSYSGNIEQVAAHRLKEEADFETLCLYRGDGKGSFINVAADVGLQDPILPMGSNFGDINNDGYLDFYLGTGDPGFGSLMPNLMYLNVGGRKFVDVTMASRLGHLQKGHAVSFADLDNDGDLDLFEQLGGAYPGDAFSDVLFENPGFKNHSITVKLVGKKTNRSAIGARIRADFNEDGKMRSVYRHVCSGGSFGANPLRQTIGTGSAAKIQSLEIFWPLTGDTQKFTEIECDQSIEVIEGSDTYKPLNLVARPFLKRNSR